MQLYVLYAEVMKFQTVQNVFLLLILQSFDWLAAFHVELLQAIPFIAV
jgi:hypothetical protein